MLPLILRGSHNKRSHLGCMCVFVLNPFLTIWLAFAQFLFFSNVTKPMTILLPYLLPIQRSKWLNLNPGMIKNLKEHSNANIENYDLITVLQEYCWILLPSLSSLPDTVVSSFSQSPHSNRKLSAYPSTIKICLRSFHLVALKPLAALILNNSKFIHALASLSRIVAMHITCLLKPTIERGLYLSLGKEVLSHAGFDWRHSPSVCSICKWHLDGTIETNHGDYTH